MSALCFVMHSSFLHTQDVRYSLSFSVFLFAFCDLIGLGWLRWSLA